MKIYILLVDSNATFRTSVTADLRDLGFAVFEAATVETARRVLEREPIHLLCVDAVVAGESGLTFVQELERHRHQLQVVFIGNPDRPADTETLMGGDIPVDMVLHRPVSPNELVFKIDTLASLAGLKDPASHGFGPVSGTPRHDGMDETEEELEFQNAYAAKLPELFGDIAAQLTTLQRSSPEEAVHALQEARRLAHTITGTSGSLGFSEVSAVAHVMENRLKETLRMSRMASLPVKSPVINLPDRRRHQSTEPSPPGNTTMAQVLVLDDDAYFLKHVETMGRDNLVQVLTAQTGEEALAIANTHHLDAAIIDILLSGDDNAFEIAHQLRERDQHINLPLAFISVDAALAQRIEAVHSGGSVFLDKPLSSEAFAAAIRRLVPMAEYKREKILVVDDDEDFLKYITGLLEKSHIETETLTSAANILEEINEINPDMVLLDVVMKEVNGLDACRVLRSVNKWRDLPILLLTVHGNRDVLLRGYEAGADDYIEKPVIREELMARINLRLERMKAFRERADIDSLTGLPTRRPFLEMLKMRLSESGRFNKPLSLCLLDLDNFKAINDTYGHLAGDRVLAGLGHLLKSRFRIMDVRGRWGGEEFVVAFYGEEEETAQMIVNRVLVEFRNITFTGDHAEEFHVSFSAGVATYPSAALTIDDLFKKVDENLYRAKRQGRNRIEI